jgi:hypothetical protein
MLRVGLKSDSASTWSARSQSIATRILISPESYLRVRLRKDLLYQEDIAGVLDQEDLLQEE